MTALWIALGLLSLAALALLLPVRLELSFADGAFSSKAHVGPVRLPFPGGSTERRNRRPHRPAKSRVQESAARAPSDWKRLLRAHWRQALEALGELLRRPVLTRLELEIDAGGADPAACALAYGRSWALVGSALPLVRSVFRVGKEAIQIRCEANLEKTAVRGRAVFTLRVFELLQALLVLAKLVQRLRNSTQTTKKAVQQP